MPDTYCTGGWVDPRPGQDEKSCPNQVSIAGPSSPQRVSIQTALFKPTHASPYQPFIAHKLFENLKYMRRLKLLTIISVNPLALEMDI